MKPVLVNVRMSIDPAQLRKSQDTLAALSDKGTKEHEDLESVLGILGAVADALNEEDREGLMTDAEYISHSGILCPKCHSDNIEGAHMDSDGDGASQEITCNDCHSTWYDIHRLVGYDNFKEG